MDRTLGEGVCCATIRPEEECRCQIYVHVCVGVGLERRNFYRDCSLLHHNSRVIAGTQFFSNYNFTIPFHVRWPVQTRPLGFGCFLAT
ncbi:unnamed protein product [Gongylonema pulchrum]|uniref:Uncharacterized protein n=1 Tax=Gongylonema pulchrum TaxID=637853 RepID=A0A183CUJ9_9BILA|nr:unnamed protein product [Gongylonema pulchrum]